MKSFKQFIYENKSEYLDGKQLLNKLGKRSVSAIAKHPVYRHLLGYHSNIYHKIEITEHGHKIVHVGTIDALGNIHKVEFHLSRTGGKVDAHRYLIHNSGDVARDGSKNFKIKSQSGFET